MGNTLTSVPRTGQQRKAIKPTRVTISFLEHKGASQDSPWKCCCYLSPPLEPLAQPVIKPLSCSSGRTKPCKQRRGPLAYSLNNSKGSKLTPWEITGEKQETAFKNNPKLHSWFRYDKGLIPLLLYLVRFLLCCSFSGTERSLSGTEWKHTPIWAKPQGSLLFTSSKQLTYCARIPTKDKTLILMATGKFLMF